LACRIAQPARPVCLSRTPLHSTVVCTVLLLRFVRFCFWTLHWIKATVAAGRDITSLWLL
jgi:hypothetical protein